MYLLPLTMLIVSFFLTFLLLRLVIPRLRRYHCAQLILEIGPNWHAAKSGTPTMGGITFLLVFLLLGTPALFFLRRNAAQAPFLGFSCTLLYTLATGLIGVLDDLAKLRHKKNEGLTPLQKYLLQLAVSGIYLFALMRLQVLDSTVAFPFGGPTLRLGWLFYPFALLFLTGFVNSVNLTDGIDGLAASVTIVVGLSLFVFAQFGNAPAVSLCASFLIGISSAFLCFNHHPAKIFMGDTGSLFLGALVSGAACLTNKPLFLFFCGIVYLAEAASDILQVAYYKLRHRRIFRMAPLHHHFELCGWSEQKIVCVFTIVTVLGALLGLWGYAWW